ncbi:uncharacterized protein LOC110902204 [Helianthus annuus]|uniref:uncharacterized protein LOC110902204 n=1 Tax=Helianthus annuus TaxID=4232 RepID=UPI000B9094ED|nr:uncharacterized protein LOC110902204 [Helianthus annuus]
MADSNEINSHPVEQNENGQITLTGAELKAIIDGAVTQALERQYEEYSGTRSRTHSAPHLKPKTHSEAHSKPPPKKNEPKKDGDDRQSTNHQSVPSQQLVLHQEPRNKGCTYKQRSLRNKEAEKRKREDDGSRKSNKKHRGSGDSKKGSKSRKDGHNSGEKPKCKICKKQHYGRCRLESNSQTQSKPFACGICKSTDHKTLDCKKIKDATCYRCNEKGHIKTNCPKYNKKPEEAKKTNARVFRMDAKEAVQDDNVITGFESVVMLTFAPLNDLIMNPKTQIILKTPCACSSSVNYSNE